MEVGGVMEILDSFLKLVGAVVVAGGSLSLLIYQIFKHLAAKWLDSRFDERLQALKHEHGKQLEQLRFKISALLDRAAKLHQREFEVLPESWSKLNDAYGNARLFVAALQSYPDIDNMTVPQQEEFIAKCRLFDWEKNQLKTAQDKNKFYQKHIFRHNQNDSQAKASDAYTFTLKNGIFIDDQIRAKFAVIHDLIWNALLEHQFNEEDGIRPRQREKINELNQRGEELMKELERVVHERLWPKESVEL